MKIGILGAQSPLKIYLSKVIKTSLIGYPLTPNLFEERPLSNNKHIITQFIPLINSDIRVELMELQTGSCDQNQEYKNFKSCDILIFHTNQLTNSNLNLLIAIGDLKKSNQRLFIINSNKFHLDDPFTEIPTEIKNAFYEKYSDEMVSFFNWPKKPTIQNYRLLLESLQLQIRSGLPIINDEKTDKSQSGDAHTHLIETCLPDLRAQLLQKYIACISAVPDEELNDPIKLVHKHSQIAIQLDEEFRKGCLPLFIGHNSRLDHEYSIFQHQLTLSLQLAQDSFNPQYDIAHLSQNARVLSECILTNRCLQEVFINDLVELKNTCDGLETTALNIHQLTMEIYDKATKLTLESKQIYDHSKQQLVDLKNKLQKQKRAAFFKILIIGVGLAFTGYAFYSAYQLGGLSLCAETATNLVVDKVLETLAPPLIRPLISLAKAGVMTSVSTPATPNIMPSLPSVETHLKNSTNTSILPNFNLNEFKMPMISSPAKCSSRGYWDAIVTGFHKEDQYTKLAFDMGKKYHLDEESRRNDFAGMMGAFMTARGHNIYRSVSNYHKTCS